MSEPIDLSIPFDAATPAWPGDTPFECGWSWSMAAGASVNVSRWTLSPHVGTHADAPLHVREGASGADRIPLAPFLGEVIVLDVSMFGPTISHGELERAAGAAGLDVAALHGAERLFLRTGACVATGSFPDSWPTLDAIAARHLAEGGLSLLGVDAPSVDDREARSLAVHHALFDNGAFVIENLDLRGVKAGRWDLLALPLKVGNVDAAPVRAFLRARH